jgi:hypothetical protein
MTSEQQTAIEAMFAADKAMLAKWSSKPESGAGDPTP